MKRKKLTAKLLSLFVMAAMLISMLAVNVGAAEVDPKPGDTPNPAMATKGYLTLLKNKDEGTEAKDSTYSVYKVLDAISYVGQDVYEYEFTEKFEAFATENKEVTVEKIAGLADGNMDYTFADPESADQLAAKLENYVLNNPAVTADVEMKAGVRTELEVGYYLVLETKITEGFKTTKPILVGIPTDTNDEMEGAPQYIYDMEITLKDQHIPITKTIEESEKAQQDSIAQQVGKEYTYKVVQQVPKYDDTYKNIIFKVTDTMSKGLDFVKVESVKAINADGSGIVLTANAAQDGYGWTEPTKDPESGKTTLVFEFSDLTKTVGTDYYDFVKNAERVEIIYTAKLNKDASFGPTGNINEVIPTVGDGPNTTTDGDKDVTITYAGLLELTKKNTKGVTLEGTEFGVYEDKECKTPAKLVTYTMNNDGTISEIRNDDLSATAKTDKNGVVRFEGLGDRVDGDEPDYWIKEIESTSGYVLLKEPIALTVKVKHPDGIKDGTEKAIFTYKVEGNGVAEGTVKVDETTGKVTVDVINQQGFTLPITGGNGIYLFIACGVIFFIAAAVMILKPKKKLDK